MQRRISTADRPDSRCRKNISGRKIIVLPARRRSSYHCKQSTNNTKVMSAQKQNEYLLLFRGSQWDKGLSTERLQKVMEQFKGWFERLQQEGIVKAGQPLEREGRIVSKATISDGPFAESKEAIGGYFIVQADTLDEAVAIARQSPVIEYGSTVEVRPIAGECPTFRRVKDQ